MTASAGTKIPDVQIHVLGEDGMPQPVSSAEVLGKGKVVVVPDQGHFVLWKRPDLVTREILDVLDRTESPR